MAAQYMFVLNDVQKELANNSFGHGEACPGLQQADTVLTLFSSSHRVLHWSYF